jgi:hypothetical protein
MFRVLREEDDVPLVPLLNDPRHFRTKSHQIWVLGQFNK